MHTTANAAYTDGLRQLLSLGEHVGSVADPTSKASNFGESNRPYIEMRGHHFSLSSPFQNQITVARPPMNVAYAIGLLCWTLRGADDVASLAYYMPAAKDFSDDGYTLCGAFGRRMFGIGPADDQIARVSALLRQDPYSRRAYVSILSADDNFIESREYPCAAGLQFFARRGRLHVSVVMRAQQAMTVLPYDLFLFSSLQILVAARLDLVPGEYRHTSGTFHIYEDEIETAQAIVGRAKPTESISTLDYRTAIADLELLQKVEAALRYAALANDIAQVRLIHEKLETESTFVSSAVLALTMHALSVGGDADTWIPDSASLTAIERRHYIGRPNVDLGEGSCDR